MSECAICNTVVTDEDWKHEWLDPDFPEHTIGPYCPDCRPNIRICSGCHVPTVNKDVNPHSHSIQGTCVSGKNWYCDSCIEHIEVCGHCGEEKAIHKTVRGKKYCSDCYHQNYQKCDCCGTEKTNNSMMTDGLKKAQSPELTEKYPSICNRCYNKERDNYTVVPVKRCKNCMAFHSNDGDYCDGCQAHLPECHDCGSKTHNNAFKIGNGELQYICHTCIKKRVECDSCHSHVKEVTKVRGVLSSDKNVCSSCVNEDRGECKSCGGWHELRSDGVCHQCFLRYGDNNSCTFCGTVKDHRGNCRKCSHTQVYDYSLKPQLYMNYTKKDVKKKDFFFFGIENETAYTSREMKDGTLRHLYNSYDPTILLAKDDSSLPQYSFEVVTQPMTFRFFKDFDLSKMFNPHMVDSPKCGMHIHVSRKAFKGDIHMYKIINFIQDLEEIVDKIVGRSYNNYNMQFNKKPSKIVKDLKEGRSPSRHCRINLDLNETVEFRMFAAAIKEETLRKNVEFLHALITWTDLVSIEEAKSYDRFKEWVSGWKKEYPNLHEFLKEV